jgi:hypothetical protein
MTTAEIHRNCPADAVATDQHLLEACATAFLASNMIRQNPSVEASDHDTADKLDRYHQALERVSLMLARAAIGRRMKAIVALRALQSVAGDLQPEERCGLAALADLLGTDMPSGKSRSGEAMATRSL